MDYALLAAELAEPAYAGLLPDSPGGAVDLLNATSTTAVKTRFVTARGVLAEVGPAGAVALDKLEAFAASAAPVDPLPASLHSAVKWAMRFITQNGPESGIDVGHASTRSLLDAMVTIGVLTQVEVDAIKGMAAQPASRAEELFGVGTRVTEADVAASQGA